MRIRDQGLSKVVTCAALALGALGCGDDSAAKPDAAIDAAVVVDAPPDAPSVVAVAKRPSKSSTVAITDDDAYVVMVNPENDSVSIFRTSDNMRIQILQTGDEPSAVVIHPNGKTAFVANRAAATVVKINDITSGAATITGTANVGSEPAGLALTPTGLQLFVAEYAEGTISRINTTTMADPSALDLIIAPSNPRALTITNDGDAMDADEFIIAPEFFGEVATDGTQLDANMLDRSRTGRVRIYDVATLTPQTPITFAPVNAGAAGTIGASSAQFTSPNQLYTVALRRDPAALTDSTKGRIYVTSISASPEPPARFNGNVYPVVYVGDLSTKAEITTASTGGTTNLAKPLFDAAPAGFAGKLMLSEVVDLSFVSSASGDSNIAYAVARGADVVQRVEFQPTGTTVGAGAIRLQIDVTGAAPGDVTMGCKGPNGIVVAHSGANAYVNCWHSRRLGVVALGSAQSLTVAVEAVTAPTGAELTVAKGRRFYFTGRGRWSGDGSATVAPTINNLAWSSCGSCHPDGLSDNITWIFGAGPRQSTAMDGSYSHGPAPIPQKQRVFNWTGIIDEIHDFERNTRGVSGGLGAVTSSATCGMLATETRKAVQGELAQPVKEVQDDAVVVSCVKDWDEIEEFSKTIRPPRGLRRLDPTLVATGAAIFGAGTATNKAGCVYCHGGAGWTISRRHYTPSTATNTGLLAAAFTGNAPWPTTWNNHTTQIQVEQNGAAGLGPAEVSCVTRNLTFGTNPNTFGAALLEEKPDGSIAQGAFGYNVPSLYGMSLGAPYLHHGLAASAQRDARGSLQALFTTATWLDHYRAGNLNYDTTSVAQRDALVEFILSIDAATPEIPANGPIPDAYDKCP